MQRAGEPPSDIKRIIEIYQWKIPNFNKLPNKVAWSLGSNEFVSYDCNRFKLHLYPRGRDESSKDYFSLYVTILDSRKRELLVQYKLSVYNSVTDRRDFSKGYHTKFSGTMSSGFRRFIKRSDILSQSESYLVNNELNLCCELDFTIKKENVNIPDSTLNVTPVATDLWSFFEHSRFTDINIVSGTKIYRCHKMILAARSPIFFTILTHKAKSKACQNPEIQLQDIEPNVTQQMIRYIYTGEVKKFDGIMEGLLKVADKYRLIDLNTLCQHEFYEKLSRNNAADTLIAAHKLNLKKLKEDIIKYINKNRSSIVQSSGYRTLETTYPALLEEIVRAQVDGRAETILI